jgi:hypothetical protein
MATEPAVQQLAEALQQLEAFGLAGPPGERGLPQLPEFPDDALMEHLARGLRSVVRIRGAGIDAVPTFQVAEAVRDLRAAVALLQEWVVPGCA